MDTPRLPRYGQLFQLLLVSPLFPSCNYQRHGLAVDGDSCSPSPTHVQLLSLFWMNPADEQQHLALVRE